MTEKRPLLPALLIAAGIVVLIGAVASVFLLSGEEDTPQTGIPNQDLPYPQIRRVDLSTSKSAFDAGGAVFVDVRDQVYFENGHIPGAKSIPLSEFESRMDELDPDDWIILYCT